MADIIRMPKMSDTMEEGVIAAWNVKVGDVVKSGDILAEVETDKATMDMESYYDGTVLFIGVQKGDAVPIDAIMAVIGTPGEDFQSLLGAEPLKETTIKAESISAKLPIEIPVEVKIDTSNIKAALVTMPLLSDTMTEGVINKWLKKVGDVIKSGDIIAEIETDKATMEIEAYDDGTLLFIGVQDGQAAPINSVIAVIGEPGADYEALIKANSGGALKKEESSSTEKVIVASEAVENVKTESNIIGVDSFAKNNGRILASPLAKSLAKEKGVDLGAVTGTGEGGRIVKSDVDSFVPSLKPILATESENLGKPIIYGQESFEEISLSQMRKAIARSLAESQTTAVDFQLTMEINMDKSIAARTVMNEASPVKISFNDMVLKACGVALKKHPNVNSSWKGDTIRKNHHVHIGMAVAIPDGLLVPVIRFADTLSLSVLAASTKELGGKAKNGQLQPKDWEGNTFTVSNLGMFGIDSFTSIINNPKNESCILSVGGIKEVVAVKNGQFYATNCMKVTLTCDHRVVDGASGAAFLVTLKELLEEPYKLLV